MEEEGREHTLRSVATPSGPLSLGVQSPPAVPLPFPQDWEDGATSSAAAARAFKAQPQVPAILTRSPEGDEGGESGAGGFLGERPWAPHPRTSPLRDHNVPDEVGGTAWSVELEGSRDATGTRTLAQQCWVCHHQRLLLFPALFFTDSKVKSKT